MMSLAFYILLFSISTLIEIDKKPVVTSLRRAEEKSVKSFAFTSFLSFHFFIEIWSW